MGGLFCGVVTDSDTAAQIDPISKRRRMEIKQLKFVSDLAVPPEEETRKRRRVEIVCKNEIVAAAPPRDLPKFAATSVCGRRREMEDTVSIHPSFSGEDKGHFFGVFDGHGCSHVAVRCKDRLHEIVKQEVGAVAGGDTVDWKGAFERSFEKMDKEVAEDGGATVSCRCELRAPHSEAVGSTAIVAVVTPDKIVVSNVGDSRAVLSRNGVAVPLSSDHKPDRPDELARIERAGGRVIYWDGARVLGVLAMSRAIGDGYLRPFVISEPEVTVIERSPEDECLILGSDGLWDVVSNETVCGVAGTCLKARKHVPATPVSGGFIDDGDTESSDEPCSDATILLTNMALARGSTDNVSVVVVDLRTSEK